MTISLIGHLAELFPIGFIGDFESWKQHADKHFAECSLCQPESSIGRTMAARAGYETRTKEGE